MQAGASIPIYRWWQMHHGHLLNKKLLKHVFVLYSLPIIFSKNFLARYARSIAFYPQLTNAICFTSPIYIYIFFIFGVIIPDCQLPKFTENAHKIAHKMSKNCLRGGVGGGEAWRKTGVESWEWGKRHGCLGDRRPCNAGKLDHIGVGSYSTLAAGGGGGGGARHFCQRLCMNKISEILHHICPKK